MNGKQLDAIIEEVIARKNLKYGEEIGSYQDYLKVKETQADMSRKLTLAHSELELVKNDLALERSIIKWYGVLDGTVLDHGSKNCPLCKRFRNIQDYFSCNGCHVKEKSRENGCGNTPYQDWYSHHLKKHAKVRFQTKGRRIQCPKCYELAVREVKFLKSLVRNPIVLESKEGIKKRKGYSYPPIYIGIDYEGN